MNQNTKAKKFQLIFFSLVLAAQVKLGAVPEPCAHSWLPAPEVGAGKGGVVLVGRAELSQKGGGVMQ